jgi:hypothetical protein
MVQEQHRPHLAVEPTAGFAITSFVADEFEGDLPAERLMSGAVDHAHAALAQFFQESVRPEPGQGRLIGRHPGPPSCNPCPSWL